MTTTIKAHFDGKVFVPDEPVDIPVGESLTLTWQPSILDTVLTDPSDRRRALEQFFDLGVPGGNVPDEALSREYIYEDRF